MDGNPRRGGKACGAQAAEAPVRPGWRPSNLNPFLRFWDPLAEAGVLALASNFPPSRFRFSAFPPRQENLYADFCLK